MIKIAVRNILRNKASSFINIAGLSVGLGCVLLIVLYIDDELSYDRFFSNSDKIYQVNLTNNMGGGDAGTAATTPPPVGAALVNNFPEIQTYTRIFRPSEELVRYAEGQSTQKYFTETSVAAVDSNFFQVFDYEMIEGDHATSLLQSNSVVITERTANKYFGNSSAMGKVLLFGNQRQPFVVTGILKNIPSHSTLQFDIFRTIASYPVVKRFNWSWVWQQVSTYVKLADNAETDKAAIQRLESKFPAMVKVQAASGFRRIGRHIDEYFKNGGIYQINLQPLTDVHLRSAKIFTRYTTLGDIKQVYIFSVIAFFIMLLACVNFMNLSTAHASKRAKEIGIRKVLGSFKKQLVRQFLVEALLYSSIAAIIAVVAVIFLLEPFNRLADKSLSVDLLFSGRIFIYLITLVLVSALLAGLYPAFYLTSFKPIQVLKGNFFKPSGGNRSIRNGLVVFQFAVSTALIICTVIVFQQLKYASKVDLGLNKNNIIVISNTNRLENKEESFREEVTKLPGISTATISSSVPTKNTFADSYTPQSAGEVLDNDVTMPSFMVDEHFIPSLELKLVSGRNFSKEFNDSTSVIVNEAAVKEIGWKQPIGQYMKYPGNNDQLFKVIGVVKNFNTESSRNPMVSFALFHHSSKTYTMGSSFVLAKVEPGHLEEAIKSLQLKWKGFTADTPFDYSFLDQEFDSLYKLDRRMSVVFNLFTILAIFVACLGLFGLAAFTAERRTKEIGIRKVLGASVESLATLLSKDFIKLVFIASLIAFPIAWWYMKDWLDGFAYRINIEWWVFGLGAFTTLIIALATVSFQAIKTAQSNPVKSLRSE